MPETRRLTECSDFPEVEFVEREATPESAMKVGIQLHLAGLSLLDTVSVLDGLGVERCQSTAHNWLQKADLQPSEGCNPNYVVGDETVLHINDQRYWLFATVDPDTNRLLHVRLFPTSTQALAEISLTELREKHLVNDASFWSMVHPGCRRPAIATRSDSNTLPTRIATPSDVYSKS
ncbi:hypothetical protein SAMN04488133_2907 [Halobellus limi]|uniref:DDE domain-containing protein n=1 Tax=Halobellus limi TaxID=699433 RepID=A0A1H6BQ51_9EURY|nr:hypothetical protein SAMN04488133_2907 [Halobellus limi]